MAFDQYRGRAMAPETVASCTDASVSQVHRWISTGKIKAAKLGYLIAQAGGGVMREMNKVFQTGRAATTGEELPLYKVPLVGRFVGDTQGQSGQSQKFYEAIRLINGHEAEYKGLMKSGRREEASAYLAENPAVRLIMAGNHAESQVRKLRSVKRDLIENEADPAKVRDIDQKISETMRRFNERVAAATG